ncbi:WhiB family transcriptional regulator [Rhodococcoides fascians]|uniref:WhiB family transcriptional regulator n=1 Tax=Rhodococcoides fascians TaxID=1828 RepID=UPI0009B892A2|nr:WhiB family transcriptional regulator [Rhodococcus fascians]
MIHTRPSVDRHWRRHARCRGFGYLFFGVEHESRADRIRRESQAKRLCDGCPVIERCRRYALAQSEAHGIWGGTTEVERTRQADCRTRGHPTCVSSPAG